MWKTNKWLHSHLQNKTPSSKLTAKHSFVSWLLPESILQFGKSKAQAPACTTILPRFLPLNCTPSSLSISSSWLATRALFLSQLTQQDQSKWQIRLHISFYLPFFLDNGQLTVGFFQSTASSCPLLSTHVPFYSFHKLSLSTGNDEPAYNTFLKIAKLCIEPAYICLLDILMIRWVLVKFQIYLGLII